MFNNYRQVSFSCVLSKVFENVMYSRLIEHLQNCKILMSNQFGFRKFPYVYRCDLVSPEPICESLFIEIDKHVFRQQSNIILGVIYRPPNTDINSFNETLSTILEKLKVEDKICYLMDYNINLLNYSSHSLTSDFVDLMHSYSFISLINRPTRITENSAPLIDNIFVNKPNLSSFQAILVTDISDHLPLIYI